MKKHEFRPVYFGAGQAYNEGMPSSFWIGMVQYTWNPYTKVFHVWTRQILGTGSAENSYDSEYYAESVKETLEYFRELQNHFKEEYGA